jgi:hypothetical protein
MRNRQFHLWRLTATLCLGLVAGCATLDLPDKLDLSGPSEKFETPTKMTALWTDTVLVEAGVVGFGGRVMFYGRGEEDPIKVDGELIVFAYDDTESVKEGALPARKFVFRKEELSRHYSESKLGHSYSFWIPWDRVGGSQRQVSLIARFKSAQGGVVMSEMTKHLLPGAAPSSAPVVQALPATGQTPAMAATTVAQASHQTPVAIPAAVAPAAQAPTQPLTPAASVGMETTTITLSDALGPATPSQVREQLAAAAAVVQAQQTQQTSAATPAVAPPAAPGNATSVAPTEIQEIVRAAVQEALAANEEERSVDRFGRRKYRARIAPKLPPTRDPGPSPQRPLTPQSGLRSTPQTVVTTGSATAPNAAPPTTQLPSFSAR